MKWGELRVGGREGGRGGVNGKDIGWERWKRLGERWSKGKGSRR